jgi:hypothetical protein
MKPSLIASKYESGAHFQLLENEHNMAIVKKASDEHGFEAESSKKIPGLEQVHKLGWLTADVVDNELTVLSRA